MRRGPGLLWALSTLAIAGASGYFAFAAGLAAGASGSAGTYAVLVAVDLLAFLPVLILSALALVVGSRLRRWCRGGAAFGPGFGLRHRGLGGPFAA